MMKVLIRKEPDGNLVVHTSDPGASVRIFDVAEMVRAIGSHDANKAYLEARNFVLQQPYSVLLQYPGGDTYYACVEALDARAAVEAAKIVWQEANDYAEAPDFEVLLVLAGHHDVELRKEDF